MKLLQKIKATFSTTAHYPDQQLTDKQLAILDSVDSYLADNCPMPVQDETIEIRMSIISLFNQHLPSSVITKQILQDFGTLDAYIPRSVSFITIGGDYVFFAGFRTKNNLTIDPKLVLLFAESLSRTNSARVIKTALTTDKLE